MGQPRQQAVLGILAMRANRVISRGELVDAVWGQDPPASAEGGIYTYVAGLRRDHRAEPVAARAGPGAGLLRRRIRASPGARPAGRRRLRAASGPGPPAAQAGDPAGAVAALNSALGLWRGIAFAGVPGPFAETERVRLASCAPRAAEERADVLLVAGPPRGSRARPDRHGRGSSAAGADARAADDRAVPQRAARRGAAGLPGRAARAGRGTRHRSRQRAVPHPPAGTDPRSRAEPGGRSGRTQAERAGAGGAAAARRGLVRAATRGPEPVMGRRPPRRSGPGAAAAGRAGLLRSAPRAARAAGAAAAGPARRPGRRGAGGGHLGHGREWARPRWPSASAARSPSTSPTASCTSTCAAWIRRASPMEPGEVLRFFLDAFGVPAAPDRGATPRDARPCSAACSTASGC